MKKSLFLFLFLFVFSLVGCIPEQAINENVIVSEIQSNNKKTDNESFYAKSDEQKYGSVLNVYYIDVGQGEACLLEYNNHFILIDAGDNDDEQLMVDFLVDKDVDKLDYVFATHPHADHIGGLDAVIDNFSIGEIYMPKVTADTQTFEDVLEALERQNLKVNIPVVGKSIILENLSIKILAPINQYEELNNNSIVLQLVHENDSFLFTGDMEADEETDLLNSGYEIQSDVIKIGHHGSDTSTTQNFIDAVNPEFAVISVGAENNYGHPDETVLNRLKDKGMQVYRTDESGNVHISSDGNDISIQCEYISENYDTSKSSDDTEKQTTELTYIGNVNSKKFHLSNCKTLPSEKNRMLFKSSEEAVNSNYVPCKNCKP